METGLSFLTLGVTDLARAARFYEQGLGLIRRPSSSGLVLFPLGALTLALHPLQELGREIGLGTLVPADGYGFPALLLSRNWPTREAVDQAYARALAAGARAVAVPAERPWGGYRGTLADPDGFLWELCHNPRLDPAAGQP